MKRQEQESRLTNDLDTLFACLADSRRRTIIRILAEETTPMPLEPVTKQIRERECGPFSTDGRDAQQEIAISLVHRHLPKMVDAEIVEVNFETDTIEEGCRFMAAVSHLEMRS